MCVRVCVYYQENTIYDLIKLMNLYLYLYTSERYGFESTVSFHFQQLTYVDLSSANTNKN